MHVAIVGAGALGQVYGVRLAKVARGVDVTFVVRASHAGARAGGAKGEGGGAMRIARLDGDRAAHTLPEPSFVTGVPSHADLVLVCVRAEQLDAPLALLLRAAPSVPIVVMTPMMPGDFARLVRELGARVLAGMPGVVSYVSDDVNGRAIDYYWLPRVAPTLIDEPRPSSVVVDELVRALSQAGFHARLELAVHETNPATTVAFIPLTMGIDAAGSIEALLGDRELVTLAIDAAREGLLLSKCIGKVPAWAGMLTRFVGPATLRIGVDLARSHAPLAFAYVEEHFGRKLHAQNVAMAKAIVGLAREKGTPHASLEGLLARLER